MIFFFSIRDVLIISTSSTRTIIHNNRTRSHFITIASLSAKERDNATMHLFYYIYCEGDFFYIFFIPNKWRRTRVMIRTPFVYDIRRQLINEWFNADSNAVLRAIHSDQARFFIMFSFLPLHILYFLSQLISAPSFYLSTSPVRFWVSSSHHQEVNDRSPICDESLLQHYTALIYSKS